ncbi:MAG: hypothetical protein ACRBFS_05510 [Aureispira sp.]
MNVPLHLLPAWLTLCIAVFVSGYSFRWLNTYYRLLASFLWITTAANLFGFLSIKHTGTNLSVLPILSLATLLIFTKIYLDEFLQERPPILLVMVISAVIIILFDVYFSYNGLSVRHFYALGTVASDFCIVWFCLYYFWKSLKGEEQLDRELWILSGGFLIYFSICTLLFFSINFLINESLKVVAPFWMLNAFSASFFYSFLSYRMWKYGRFQKRLATV